MIVRCPEEVGPCIWRLEGACGVDEVELELVEAPGAPKTWVECQTREETA